MNMISSQSFIPKSIPIHIHIPISFQIHTIPNPRKHRQPLFVQDRPEYGGVASKIQHIEYLNHNLKKLSGKSLYERLSELIQSSSSSSSSSNPNDHDDNKGILHPHQVDESKRFNIFSHGNESVPIYDYGNYAGLQTFAYPEEEFYQLPSCNTTSEMKGFRKERDIFMQQLKDAGYGILKDAVRVNKYGQMVKAKTILVWNLYDEDGNLTGQAAMFDNEQVEKYDIDNVDDDSWEGQGVQMQE